MKIKRLHGNLAILFVASALCLFSACRKDKEPIKPEEEIVTPEKPETPLRGMYLLNEGNMNSNKSSLDYVDFRTGAYRRNIYQEINPEITLGLGDVGNDIGIYGSKLYVVLNNSNKIEVLDAKSAKKIGQIDIQNVRYITFAQGKAYASAYLGTIGDPDAANGIVAEIDTTSLKITRRAEVGRQPEELAVIDDKLYIANSGGYSPPDYESTVSVVDLNSFREVKRIEVAPNLHRLKADADGDLYVSSRGDYYETPSRLYVIDTKTEKVKKRFDIAVNQLVISGDMAYTLGAEFSYETGGYVMSYHTIDVKKETLLERSFITDGTAEKIDMPYGLAVNPSSREVYLTDAKDFVSPGTLYCFSPEGTLKWSVTTGDIPVQFAFVYE